MEPTRNDTSVQESSDPTNSDRCRKVTAIFCIVISTVVFLGSVTAIVWLFERKLPYRYSVVCFMMGSGTLYVVAFTSSMLLLTRKLPKRSRMITREQPNLGLQLPPRVNCTMTPSPAYKEPSEIFTSQNSINQVQSNQDPYAGISLDRFYYELNREDVQESELVQRPLKKEQASGFDIEMQTMPTASSITGSVSSSNPVTNALKQQIALEKQGETSREILLDQIGNSEHLESDSSQRSALKVKRNPSLSVKRKLKAKLSVSHPDLLSEGSQNFRSNLQTEMRISHSNLNPEEMTSQSDRSRDTCSSKSNLSRPGTPRMPRSNAEVRTSQSNLNPQRTPRLPRSNPETRTSLSNLNPQGTPRMPRSNTEARTSLSNLNPKGTPRMPRSNTEARTSLSNLNPQVTPRLPRSNPEARTSLSNLNPQRTPKVLRSNAEVRISESNLNSEGRLQISQLDCNEEMKSSQSNLRSQGTPQIARSNLGRTSQMNLIPAIRFQTSQSSLNFDIERTSSNLNPEGLKVESLSNLTSERKQFDSKSNYLPTEIRFTSHSNLHLNAQPRKSDANSYGLLQLDTNSTASLETSQAKMVGEYLKQASQPAKHFQKMSQPQQFVACSENVPKLQKAQSFAALSVPNSLTRLQMKTVPKTTNEQLPENASSARQMSGRSIESVLDATRNTKQMTPQEWIVAWNHGFRKLPTEDGEKVVGVRI